MVIARVARNHQNRVVTGNRPDHPRQPGPQREIRRRGVGGVQGDKTFGDVGYRRRQRRSRAQLVSSRQAGPAYPQVPMGVVVVSL